MKPTYIEFYSSHALTDIVKIDVTLITKDGLTLKPEVELLALGKEHMSITALLKHTKTVDAENKRLKSLLGKD